MSLIFEDFTKYQILAIDPPQNEPPDNEPPDQDPPDSEPPVPGEEDR